MAAVSSSSQTPATTWSNPPSSERVEPPAAVQDDWENDEDESDSEEANRRIWEAANAKAPVPMPSVILSPSSTSARAVLSPPEGAFQPTMRILKRPTNSNSTPSPIAPSASAETLQEKEARYQAARERIFGPELSEEKPSAAVKEKKDKKSPKPTHAPVRNPRGPTTSNGTPQKGFGERRTKPPTPPQSESASTA